MEHGRRKNSAQADSGKNPLALALGKAGDAKIRIRPLAEKTKVSPIGINAADKRIIFEGTIVTLPSHSPLVARWLKVYFLYDPPTKSIRHMTITIRGEAQE